MAVSTIASEQTNGTEKTLEKAYQVLDYLASLPNATVRFHASDMVINHKHPFRCFILKQNECTQQSVRAFFHGRITNRWETHKTQWRVSHIVCYTAVHRSVCGRSQTGSIVPKLPGRDDF